MGTIPVIGYSSPGVEEFYEYLDERSDKGEHRDEEVSEGVGDSSQMPRLIPVQARESIRLLQDVHLHTNTQWNQTQWIRRRALNAMRGKGLAQNRGFHNGQGGGSIRKRATPPPTGTAPS